MNDDGRRDPREDGGVDPYGETQFRPLPEARPEYDAPFTPIGYPPYEDPAAQPPTDPGPYVAPGSQPYSPQPYSPQPYSPQPYPNQPYPPQPYPNQGPYGAVPYVPGYPAPGLPWTPQAPTSTKAIISLVCGIVSVVGLLTCWVSVFVSLPTGLAAVVLGALARSEITRSAGGRRGEGMALAGLITGVVGIIGAIVYAVIFFVLIASSN